MTLSGQAMDGASFALISRAVARRWVLGVGGPPSDFVCECRLGPACSTENLMYDRHATFADCGVLATNMADGLGKLSTRGSARRR